MTASIDTLIRWASKHRRETSAPPRAYTGPYPDLDGPTCAQMDAVQTAVDALEQENIDGI